MPSDYLGPIVALGYYAGHRKIGTQAERDRWSNDLYRRYDGPIRTAATQAGVPVNVENRSIMAVLARLSPGNSASRRAGRAVAAYRTFLGV